MNSNFSKTMKDLDTVSKNNLQALQTGGPLDIPLAVSLSS